MWVYLTAVLLGVGVAIGWFAFLEWLNRRNWKRYLRDDAERRRLKCEVARRE